MDEIVAAIVLQAIGIGLLVLEIFIPSHGALTISGLACLVGGVWFAFRGGDLAGYVSVLVAVVLVPSLAIVAVKVWHRTPLGRKISPPNPKLTQEDAGVRIDQLRPLIGSVGRSLTPLRPVGTCEFNGQRIECMAEMGIIEASRPVRAVRIEGRALVVQPHQSGGGDRQS